MAFFKHKQKQKTVTLKQASYNPRPKDDKHAWRHALKHDPNINYFQEWHTYYKKNCKILYKDYIERKGKKSEAKYWYLHLKSTPERRRFWGTWFVDLIVLLLCALIPIPCLWNQPGFGAAMYFACPGLWVGLAFCVASWLYLHMYLLKKYDTYRNTLSPEKRLFDFTKQKYEQRYMEQLYRRKELLPYVKVAEAAAETVKLQPKMAELMTTLSMTTDGTSAQVQAAKRTKEFVEKTNFLSAQLFHPQVEIDAYGNRRFIKSTLFKKPGFPINVFPIFKPDDVKYIEANGMVPESVWDEGWNSEASIPDVLNDKSLSKEVNFDITKQFDCYLTATQTHTYIEAKTGGGKTALCIQPTMINLLCAQNPPTIILNSKGDDLEIPYTLALLQGMRVLNFSMVATEGSNKYNLMSSIYNMARNLYRLENYIYSEITDITLDEYNSTWMFDIRPSRHENHMDDDLTRCKEESIKMISYRRLLKPKKRYKNGQLVVDPETNEPFLDHYMRNPTDILEQIMEVTGDYYLKEDLFNVSNGGYNLETITMPEFVQYLIHNYDSLSRKGHRPDYIIGQIRTNFAAPSRCSPEDNLYWFGGNRNNPDTNKLEKVLPHRNTAKHWILCGTMAFENLESLQKEWTTMRDTLLEQIDTNLEMITNVLTLDKNTDNGGNAQFFNVSARGLFNLHAKAFIAGLRMAGDQIFAEEYFTTPNICRQLSLYKTNTYSTQDEVLSRNLFMNVNEQGDSNNPLELIVQLCQEHVPKITKGIAINTVAAPQTWAGIEGSFNVLFTTFMSNKVMQLSTFSTMYADELILFPSLVMITMNAQGDKAPINRIINILLNSMFEAYQYYSKYTGRVSPQTVFLMLDEFGVFTFDTHVVDYFLVDGRALKLFAYIVVQQEAQVTKLHGEPFMDSVENNCLTQVFLGTNSIKSAKKWSEKLGTYYKPDVNSLNQSNRATFSTQTGTKEAPLFSVNDLLNKYIAFNRIGLISLDNKKWTYQFPSVLSYSSISTKLIDSFGRKTVCIIPYATPEMELYFDYIPYIFRRFYDSHNYDAFEDAWANTFVEWNIDNPMLRSVALAPDAEPDVDEEELADAGIKPLATDNLTNQISPQTTAKTTQFLDQQVGNILNSSLIDLLKSEKIEFVAKDH